MNDRITWQEYFIEFVKTAAKRASCDRGKSGAVIVKDNQIISTGYVGSAAGTPHCDDIGHQYEYRIKDFSKVHKTNYIEDPASYNIDETNISQHCIRTIHAEQNAICQAAKHGHSVNGATMYCTMVPCRTCAMMIINSGIKLVIAINEYQTSQQTKDLFKNRVALKIINKKTLEY